MLFSISLHIFAQVKMSVIMKIVDLSKNNTILNKFVSELRDVNVQGDSMRFRRNVERIGEIMAYEISKELQYGASTVRTPLADSVQNVPLDKVVLATILRAGLPLHQGFHNIFDDAGNAFVSAYREYTDETHFDVKIEYLASPRLEDKTLLLVDTMLATGSRPCVQKVFRLRLALLRLLPANMLLNMLQNISPRMLFSIVLQ